MLGFLESPKKENTEYFRTSSFKTRQQAIKNKVEIKQYFSQRVLEIDIEKDIDGFYVWYILTKNLTY